MWYLFCSSPGAAVPGFEALTAACSCSNTMRTFADQSTWILDSFKPLVAAELIYDTPTTAMLMRQQHAFCQDSWYSKDLEHRHSW